MRASIAALLVLLLAAPAWAQEPAAAPEPPTLSEVEQLRIEAHLLRLRVAQLEEQLATVSLTHERERLDAEIRHAHDGWRMDWTTGRLVAVDAAPPPDDESEDPE